MCGYCYVRLPQLVWGAHTKAGNLSLEEGG